MEQNFLSNCPFLYKMSVRISSKPMEGRSVNLLFNYNFYDDLSHAQTGSYSAMSCKVIAEGIV